MAVAVGGAVTVTTRGARLLSVPRRLAAIKNSSFVTRTSSSSKLGFCPVRLRNNEVARKKLFIIRAARTESQGVSLGFRAPNFELSEPLTGKTWTLEDFESYPALLVMFICNHCPFVKLLKKDFVKLSDFYMKKGLAVVAISSNSVVTHPQDGPQFMAEEAKLYKYPFPYLYDETQDVARDFGAVCTPEFFLFKKDGRRPFELVYHGQFDDSRPSNDVPVTGRDLSLAIDSVLSGQPVSSIQKPSLYDSADIYPTAKLLHKEYFGVLSWVVGVVS
ncbi:Alkyl hydroperoxide reductase subunit C/ Thiol specific antioxidant [Corchorus olitorius]|uniref:Alkyl hydroperoxide reductase subunit C/ Thiol specific antioxidant n=1 Tax=Corchorus olitorius TaxID=93759 RepID=A0A1R3KPH1_9ROSI|nr:Alkyl hydroperoxide reductase subunit C/ Thiol specific antioxidant [Corchorus olitorius]